MEICSKGVQTNQEMPSIRSQTDMSLTVFFLITKDQSTQFNGIGQSILKPKKIPKQRMNIKTIIRPATNQILTFYNQIVVTTWRKEKSKMK